MTLNNLAKKTLTAHVERANGAGEVVLYKSAKNNIELEARCYPQLIDLHSDDKFKDTNTMVFRALSLDFVPAKNDTITYIDKIWKVDNIQHSVDLYDIVAYIHTHTLGGGR